MENSLDLFEIVQKAQLGNQECMNDLANLVRIRLYRYVYRIVLHDALAEDIVQETIIEMIKIFGKLKRNDRFWPWIYGIATNKIRRYYRGEMRQRVVSLSQTGVLDLQDHPQNKQDGLAQLVTQELKQVILAAMRSLRPPYREVLSLRCYEEMEFSQIAEVMGKSEFATRILFFRAKKSLQKQLARNGLGKGALLTALLVFGKLTAPSEAAASQVCVTVGMTQVGLGASLAGMAVSTAGVVTLTAAAGIITAVPLVGPAAVEKSENPAAAVESSVSSVICPGDLPSKEHKEEIWYFYPEARQETVMIRQVQMEPSRNQPICQWIQNKWANYMYQGNTVQVNNYHIWKRDLGVWRLPTDDGELTNFIAGVEGGEVPGEGMVNSQDNLLVMTSREAGESGSRLVCTCQPNMLEEEFFQYIWPRNAQVMDGRDAMHQRGWTYFRITGMVEEEVVKGTGRVPFVYASSSEHTPWLRMQVADRMEILDCTNGAEMKTCGQAATACPSGSFFAGLSRPWMGLHTIDTVRRDAARQKIRFQTKYEPGQVKAQVILTYNGNRLVYIVDMEKDVVERIEFMNSNNQQTGFLEFAYLQDIRGLDDEFSELTIRKCRSQETDGILWLFSLSQMAIEN